MKRKLAIVAASLLVIGFSKARPAGAEGTFDCGDPCSNSSTCTTQGCILCDHPTTGEAKCN